MLAAPRVGVYVVFRAALTAGQQARAQKALVTRFLRPCAVLCQQRLSEVPLRFGEQRLQRERDYERLFAVGGRRINSESPPCRILQRAASGAEATGLRAGQFREPVAMSKSNRYASRTFATSASS